MTGVERLKKRGFSTDIPRVLSTWVKINLTGEGGFYSRSPMSVGRRKKEEALIAMVSPIKNVLTVLAVAIHS